MEHRHLHQYANRTAVRVMPAALDCPIGLGSSARRGVERWLPCPSELPMD